MLTTQSGVEELEKKVNLLSKALNLILFAEKENISKKEARQIEQRLSAYLKGKKNEFVDLEDVASHAGSKDKQKGPKRA